MESVILPCFLCKENNTGRLIQAFISIKSSKSVTRQCTQEPGVWLFTQSGDLTNFKYKYDLQKNIFKGLQPLNRECLR